MNSLPWELFDEIISYLGDKKSLRNCSLVARSWEYTSRKHLFNTVRVTGGKLKTWLNGTSQGSHGRFLNHIRHLSCSLECLSTSWLVKLDLKHGALLNHFSSLSKLRRLDLQATHISLSLEKTELMFSALKTTLSHIALLDCEVLEGLLPTLINCLPNLKCLYLIEVCFLDNDFDKEHALPISLPPLKKLYIDRGTTEYQGLLNKLWELGLRSDEIALVPTSSKPCKAFANRVIRTFGVSAKCLRLPGVRSGACGLPYSYHGDPSS